MSCPKPGWCRKGLHDLDDPANVTLLSNGRGKRSRVCKPCRSAWRQAYMERWRRTHASSTRPAVPPRAIEALQLIADGLTPAEAAVELGIPEISLRKRLHRAGQFYGVPSTAAAVYAALMRRNIKAVLRTEHPMPPCNNATRDHARSLARLIRGERLPCTNPGSAAHQRLLDDLYAFSEAHAVSVLWAARMLSRDGAARWTEPKEKTMSRAEHAAAA